VRSREPWHGGDPGGPPRDEASGAQGLEWAYASKVSCLMGLLIAAAAHAHGATLYTGNPDDLKGLEDLIDVVAV
jgi:hypothetical protein